MIEVHNWWDHGAREGKDKDSLFAEVKDQRIVRPVKWCVVGVNDSEGGE